MVVEPVEPGEPETLTLDVYSEPPPVYRLALLKILKDDYRFKYLFDQTHK